MSEEINSINQNLPNAASGWSFDIEMIHDPGDKAFAIRRWIRSLLDKTIHYQAEHRHVLDGAGTTLMLALPSDIVLKNVLSFLELPT